MTLSLCLCLLLSTGGILYSGCLCVHPCFRDHILKVCECDVVQIIRGNFAEFTTKVRFGTKINLVGFEVKRSKVEVTAYSLERVVLCS